MTVWGNKDSKGHKISSKYSIFPSKGCSYTWCVWLSVQYVHTDLCTDVDFMFITTYFKWWFSQIPTCWPWKQTHHVPIPLIPTWFSYPHTSPLLHHPPWAGIVCFKDLREDVSMSPQEGKQFPSSSSSSCSSVQAKQMRSTPVPLCSSLSPHHPIWNRVSSQIHQNESLFSFSNNKVQNPI